MLNQREESFLRKLFRESLPMFEPTQPLPTQRVEEIDDMISKSLQRGRLTTLSLEDNHSAISRVAHVMRKGEKFGEFLSRTGLGVAQMFTMTKDEITAFVAVAEANNDIREPRAPMLTFPSSAPATLPARAAIVGRNFVAEVDL